MQTNIYRITNLDSGRTYIGQTTRELKDRLHQHVLALKRGDHWNRNFQEDYSDGNTRLRIQKLAGIDGTKTKVNDLEMKYAQREAHGYNIKTGRPGDMGPIKRLRARAYDYADIIALRGKMKVSTASRPHCSARRV